MFKLILIVAVCLACMPAAAQTLQKCVGKGGAVAFRSGPCQPGETLADRRDGSSDRRTPEQWRQLHERQERHRRLSAELHQSNGGNRQVRVVNGTRVTKKETMCAVAKREREKTLKAYKGRASMELHSKLNHMVYDACKS